MTAATTATDDSTKLQRRFRGPLTIVKKFPSDTYREASLRDTNKGKYHSTTSHASQIRIWHPMIDEPPQISEISDNDESDSTEEPSQISTVPKTSASIKIPRCNTHCDNETPVRTKA